MTFDADNLVKKVKGITDDSRQIKKGYLYVAIVGRKSDGQNFTDIYEIVDREAAIKMAVSIAKPGDVVGIFGKGHEKSMNLDGRNETPLV